MKMTFLGAHLPLTKRIHKNGEKDAYPLVKNFTSYTEDIQTIEQMLDTVTKHADQGHCLLKGTITRTLSNEPRANATRTDDETQWICLDFDRHECADIDDVLNTFGIGDVSYIIQYSSSHGLPDNEGTISAHVFMLLDKPLNAPKLKSWLMSLNMTHLKDDLRLSRSKTVISWPLDITTCQNDKLLYIAPPTFIGMRDPVKNRIELVLKTKPQLDIERIGERNINQLKVEERTLLNNMRVGEGLPKRTAKTTWVGTVEIQNKPDTCEVTGTKEQGDYVRLNLNGGDSWAYWHHKDNFEIIHDFKSDTYYRTKELVPGYYQGLVSERAELNSTPSDDGDLLLAFRDLKTAEYYNGMFNVNSQELTLYRAKNETQLDHWMRSHGRIIGDFIPVWDIQYDPRADWVIDEDGHKINTFRPSPFMLRDPDASLKTKDFPTIYGIIRHLLGETGKDTSLSDAFLNWFALIMQRKAKPITAWVLHGCEGTGKGYFYNKIAAPLLSPKNTSSITVSSIEENFNGWIEGKLFILVDEVDVDDFKDKGKVAAKLRNAITEPTIPLRRMRQATIDAPNYASFIFSSNRPQPVYIPPTDRRYNVGNYQPKKLAPPDDDIVASELEKFAEWLLAHRADIDYANQIIQTEARDLIQKLGVSSVQETCNAIKDGDFDKLWLSMTDDELLNRAPVQTPHIINAQQYNMLMRHLAAQILIEPKMTLSRDEMAIILQYNVGNIRPEPNRITSLLRHNGIETKQIRHNGKKTYGINVEWKISTELLPEIKGEVHPKAKLRKIK